jgi:hypothetical protein
MEIEYQNLQKRKLGFLANGQTWTLDNIRNGLEYYRELHGNYPTSQEVDQFEFLPSARSIQRSYGGLVQLRKNLGLSGPHDHTKGKTRSAKAQEADNRAKVYEEEFFYFLSKHFAEMRIHEHKVIRPGDVSCDFFVYTSDAEGVVIDLFYAADIDNVSKIINIKYKKYLDVKFPVLFIEIGNEKISQSEIDTMIKNRKTPLPEFMKVMNESEFKANFDKLIKIKF